MKKYEGFDQTREAYLRDLEKAEKESIEVVNPKAIEEIEIKVSESTEVQKIKKLFKSSGLKVIIADNEKENKKKEKINKKFGKIFKDLGLLDGLPTSSLSGPEGWINLISDYFMFKVAEFIFTSAIGDIKTEIWKKIKKSFRNVFRKRKIDKNVSIMIQDNNGSWMVFVIKKETSFKSYMKAIEKIPDVLVRHKGQDVFRLYDEKEDRWKRVRKIMTIE
jgi:hypothetical protein